MFSLGEGVVRERVSPHPFSPGWFFTLMAISVGQNRSSPHRKESIGFPLSVICLGAWDSIQKTLINGIIIDY